MSYKQFIVLQKDRLLRRKQNEQVALFNEDGTPYSGSVVKQVVIELSAEQISNLSTEPVLLVEAPGPGLAYQILGIIWVGYPGEISYTNVADTGRLMIGAEAAVEEDYSVWESQPIGMPGVPLLKATSELGSEFEGTDNYLEMSMSGTQAFIPVNLVENQPLVVGNPGADFVDGDGTLKVTVTYTTFQV